MRNNNKDNKKATHHENSNNDTTSTTIDKVVWSIAQAPGSETRSIIIEIKNNAWVTANNDFWVTSEATCQ